MSWFMKHRTFLLLAGVLCCLCLFSMESVFAAQSLGVEEYANSTSGSKDTFRILQEGTGIAGFDNIVQQMGTELVRSARYIVAILIAASGIMVAFGIEDGKKTMWSVILGIGLILNFGSFIYTSYGNYFSSTPASSSQAQDFEFQTMIPRDADITRSEDAAKSAAQKAGGENYEDMLKPKQNPATTGDGYHFFSTFINSYMTHVIRPGAENLKGILIKLALIITVIDTTVKFAMDLTGGGSELLKKLVMLALKMGFVIFLIENWVTGPINLTQSLCNGFEELGFIAGGETSLKGSHLVLAGMSDGSVKAGWTLFSAFAGFICTLKILQNAFLILFGLVLMVFFLIGMIWLALEMFMAQVEYYTMALLTMMLLPFMMSSQTSFLSNNAIAAMFNCALKVCIIAFLSVVGMSTFGRYLDSFKDSIAKLDGDKCVALMLQFDITVLVLLFLVWQIPKLVQGLLSGNPQFGAGQMVSMVASGARTVAGVAGGVTGAMALGAAGGAAGGAAAGGATPMSAMNNINAAGADAASMTSSGGGSGGGFRLGNIGKAFGNLATNAAFNSGIAQAFRNNFNAVTDPYGVGPSGQAQGAKRSWTSGHMTDANGNIIAEDGGRSGGGNGGGGSGGGRSSETDGNEARMHNKNVTDVTNVTHDNKVEDPGAYEASSAGGRNYTVTANTHVVPQQPPPITPFNPDNPK